MLCDEINTSVVNKLDRQPSLDTAIKITNGNFFWGLDGKNSDKKKSVQSVINQGDGSSEEKKEPLIEKAEERSEGTVESLITLKDINVEIKHGEFVCIIGDVGSGKSSLLSAIIGDMLYIDQKFLEKHSNRKLEDDFASKTIKELVKEHTNIEILPD